MSKAPNTAMKPQDYRAKGGWANAWKMMLGVAVLGGAAAGYGFTQDAKRFAFSYLFALFCFLTIGLGALFFVIVQHITKSGWSVTVRRTAEFFMTGLVVLAVLVFPLFFLKDHLFPWTQGQGNAHAMAITAQADPHGGAPAADPHGAAPAAAPHGAAPAAAPHGAAPSGAHAAAGHGNSEEALLHHAHEEERAELLEHKKPYLNTTFFVIRMVVYALVWALLALRYFRLSTEQDTTRKFELTIQAQKMSPVAAMLFGLTLTFASFDWLMSLDPFWYSTIFGVTIFAGSVVSFVATLILTLVGLKRAKLIGNEVNVEHFHDLGKLQFGFLVFWAYVTFSQFFLIWYGNIPEELVFYHLRFTQDWPSATNPVGSSWRNLTIALVALHFVVPFWFLMSRNIKRRVPLLVLAATLLLVMHVVEMYWIVMPNYGPLALGGTGLVGDIGCFLFVGGAFLAVVFRSLAGHSLIAVGDPRLVRALKFENV